MLFADGQIAMVHALLIAPTAARAVINVDMVFSIARVDAGASAPACIDPSPCRPFFADTEVNRPAVAV